MICRVIKCIWVFDDYFGKSSSDFIWFIVVECFIFGIFYWIYVCIIFVIVFKRLVDDSIMYRNLIVLLDVVFLSVGVCRR